MWHDKPKEEVTKAAMARALAIVILPAGIFILGLIYFLMPPLPPVSVVEGCYQLPGGPLVRVTASRMMVDAPGQKPRAITIEYGKPEYQILAETGFSFQSSMNGRYAVVNDHPRGEIICVYYRRGRNTALDMIVDNAAREIPRINCPA